MDNFKGSQAFFNKFQNNIQSSSKSLKSPAILSVSNFNRYLPVSSHQELLRFSEKYGKDNCFCESRQNSPYINLFFDYDCKEDPISHGQLCDVLKSLKTNIQSLFPSLNILFYVKESENKNGRVDSMHIICHLSTPDGFSIYFDYSQGCSQVKFLVSKLNLQHPFDDKSAYSGHLLRLIYSNKFDKSGNLSGRILDHSPLSNTDDPLLSLSSYCPNQKYMLMTDYVNKHFILQYVKNHEYTKNYLFKDIIQRPNESHLSLTLTEQRTPVCEHKSNNAVCMLYHQDSNPNIIIKCQDAECGKFFQTFFRYDDHTHRCQIIPTSDNSSDATTSNPQSSQASNSVTPTKNKKNLNSNINIQDKNLMQAIILHICQETNQDSGYVVNNIEYIEQNGYSGDASPPQNQLFKSIAGNQKCSFLGKDNYHYYTINGVEYKVKFSKELSQKLKQPSRRYDRQELINMGIVFNQYNYTVNNNITINNKESKDETVYDDAFDSIEFPSEIHQKYFINIINDDFQFITELYNLEFPDQFIYVYDESDKGCAMYFDNYNKKLKATTDGGYWNMQGGIRVAKQRIRDYVVEFFDSIMKQLNESKDLRRKLVQIKLRSVRNVLKNNIELDQYLYETYFHRDIQFNNFPHLLHFKNGTFDLEQRKFIKTTPDMYNTFQIDYDYDQSAPYNDIHSQLSQIMLIDEFQWFLKQLSNCLNPRKVIEEKQIVILTGFGNNGKTILFNLINHTFGLKAYSGSGRSQMIQGSNASSSAATPDQAKLLYKRFCYVAELDKTLPFNQQAVKILTGGEEIQARDLYKSLITFQPSAGIFISCNQIPYIDTSDGGFLNRLKIIDLKYQFEEHPSHQFQKPIDRNLTHQVKSTEWKQGFMNLLIHFFYKDRIQLPKSIQKYIKQRINLQQNPINQWAKQILQYKEGKFILSEDMLTRYLDDTNNKIGKIKFNKQINDYFQQYPQYFSGVSYELIDIDNKDLKVRGMGFTNCTFIQ